MDIDEINTIRNKVENERLNDIDEYIDLYSDKSCLDGWFSAKELRIIADAMDQVKELTEEE